MSFDYKKWLKIALSYIMRFRYVLISTAVISVLILAIFRINQHSNAPLNQERYDEEILTIKRIDFDQDVIQQVLDLNDLNVDIESIFPNNRNNPFN